MITALWFLYDPLHCNNLPICKTSLTALLLTMCSPFWNSSGLPLARQEYNLHNKNKISDMSSILLWGYGTKSNTPCNLKKSQPDDTSCAVLPTPRFTCRIGLIEMACCRSNNCWVGGLKLGYFSSVCSRQLFFFSFKFVSFLSIQSFRDFSLSKKILFINFRD